MPAPPTAAMNDVRALRLAEVIQDFRNLQHYIAQISAYPTAEEYYAEGYALLRQCAVDGQAVLHAQFQTTNTSPHGDPEAERMHLQYVMLDAMGRRLQAQRIYLRATAAMRWINSRNALMQSSAPGPQAMQHMQQIDAALQAELSRITDQRTHDDLRNGDVQQGKWVSEDPSLPQILQWLASRPVAGTAVASDLPTSPTSARSGPSNHRRRR